MKKVLVFDDDTEIFSILTYIMEENGWSLHSQTNCNKLIEVVREISPDVILMDNWIPETGGMIATQTLKKQEDLKHIPVIYFSANNDIEALAQQAGADSFIPKPFDIDDLEKTVRGYLEKPNAIN
jgi:two-component system cell cycle response regulator DivK